MAVESWGRRIVPIVLGVGMLAVVLAAALAPNTGAISAQSNCQYGTCPSSTTPFPWWILGVIAVLVAAAIIALLLFTRRRPPAGAAATQVPPAASAGGAGPGGPTPPAGPTGEAGAASPAYLETPEDVGPSLPPVGAGVAAGAAGGAAAAEEEPDIDSLMAELDKISGEILKRAPKGGAAGGAAGAEAEEEAPK
jgi:hypothetical protein